MGRGWGDADDGNGGYGHGGYIYGESDHGYGRTWAIKSDIKME